MTVGTFAEEQPISIYREQEMSVPVDETPNFACPQNCGHNLRVTHAHEAQRPYVRLECPNCHWLSVSPSIDIALDLVAATRKTISMS